MEDTIALNENRLPFDATFILLIIHALTVEPHRNAIIEASVTLGAMANT